MSTLEGMYQFNTKEFQALRLMKLGQTHLVYVAPGMIGGHSPATLCGRRAQGATVEVLKTVDVLNAVMTPACQTCLRITLRMFSDNIKAI